MAKFYTSNGLLTAYALACGYVERRTDAELTHEHGVYHVKSDRFGPRPDNGPDTGRIWETYCTLAEARAALRRVSRVRHKMEAAKLNGDPDKRFARNKGEPR